MSSIPLPATPYSDPTGTATVSGWGSLTDGGPPPDVLYQADVPIVTDAGKTDADIINYGDGGKIQSILAQWHSGTVALDSAVFVRFDWKLKIKLAKSYVEVAEFVEGGLRGAVFFLISHFF